MYDSLADYYHLMFEDWDASIARQAAVLGTLIETARTEAAARNLDIPLRDYDRLLVERPTFQGPVFFSDQRRRIVHQVWDWTGERQYTMHLYITRQTDSGWVCHHFSSNFHALSRADVASALDHAGFAEIRWLEPAASGYYQPVVLARRLL